MRTERNHRNELNRSIFAALFRLLPGGGHGAMQYIRAKVLSYVVRQEGGVFTSQTLRDMLAKERDVHLGSFSYGTFETINRLRPQTSIGRYTSMGPGVQLYNANHPYSDFSTHPYFYTDEAGNELVKRHPLSVGDDVWLGANAIICPGCARVGTGAVVAAGSIVTKDVPEYAVVGGNPARLLKMRFEQATVDRLLESQWWQRSPEEIRSIIRDVAELPQNIRLLAFAARFKR